MKDAERFGSAMTRQQRFTAVGVQDDWLGFRHPGGGMQEEGRG
ncbi:MAG TPA: hypothetical protein VIX42_07940 [Edaphobacter sp.]